MNRLSTPQDAQRLVDYLYYAIDQRVPMTLVYSKADGSLTARKVEPYGVEISAEGATFMRVMDRRTGEPRCFRLDRIHGYSLHYKKGEDVIPNPYV